MNYERGKIATKHSKELEGPFDGRRKGAISQVFNYDRKKSRALGANYDPQCNCRKLKKQGTKSGVERKGGTYARNDF